VHVVPSREESWSQSAVLAPGLGVPVAGTAVDGRARTLGEGRGVLAPPEDPRALAGALSRVLAGERPDPALGRAYARQFTPSTAAAVYASAYRQLLASRTMPRGSSESWIRCTPSRMTAAGCPKSSASAARRKITPGSRRSAWR